MFFAEKLISTFATSLVVCLTGFVMSAQAMTFRLAGNGGNCTGCEWIAADGEITPSTPGEFEHFLVDKPYKAVVYLNSPGGNLIAGIKLGELIRSKGYDTAVGSSAPSEEAPSWEELKPGTCSSACAYAFLGGAERNAKAGELGVHQFYNEAALKDPSGKLFNSIDISMNQVLSGLVIDYVVRMGVDPRIVSIASQAPPASLHLLTDVELSELNVVWNPKQFEPWSIEPAGAGVVAFSRTKDKTETATFYCKHDGHARLLITTPLFNSVKLQEAIEELGDGIKVLGLSLPKDAASVRMVNGMQALEIQLNGFNAENASLQYEDVSVSGNYPRVNASLFYYPLNNNKIGQNIRVASRNCL